MNYNTDRIKYGQILIACIASIALHVLQAATISSLQFDYCVFRADQSHNLIELYYSTSEDQFSYATNGVRYTGGLIIEARIIDPGQQEQIISEKWQLGHERTYENASTLPLTLIGQTRFIIPAQELILSLHWHDQHKPNRGDSLSINIPATHFMVNQTSLSDIELCTNITKAGEERKHTFYKNSYIVVPSPDKIFGAGHPILFYYLESYGLDSGPDAGELRVTVVDLDGAQIHERIYRREWATESKVEIGTINLSGTPTGRYTLTIAILDTNKTTVTAKDKSFTVYNPYIEQLDELAVRSAYIDIMYGHRDQNALDVEFESAYHIATRRERKSYKGLKTVNEKRSYLYDFWKKRDTNPETIENEYRNLYLRRVEQANEQFSSGVTPGWNTDQGRVYLLYGRPDEIEYHNQPIDKKPHEIWFYHAIQGGVLFVFVDQTGFSDYYLVHSTARNELYHPRWLNELQPAR